MQVTQNKTRGNVEELKNRLCWLLKPYRKFFRNEPKKRFNLYLDEVANAGRFVEQTVVEASDGMYSLIDADAYDFSDGTECKSCTVGWQYSYSKKTGKRKTTSRAASIGRTKLDGKIGPLRVIVFEPLTDALHCFFIPYEVYNSVKGIRFSFYIDGSPRREGNANTKLNTWDYEVHGLVAMSRMENTESRELVIENV